LGQEKSGNPGHDPQKSFCITLTFKWSCYCLHTLPLVVTSSAVTIFILIMCL
jgi:hypothetical protein